MLSQCIAVDVTDLGHNRISLSQFLSHSTSSLVKSNAIISNSIVELVIHVYLDAFQDIIPLLTMNISRLDFNVI